MFPFLLKNAALVSLPTDHFVALRPLFIFGRSCLFKFFTLKPAQFCKLSAGLRRTNKSDTSLLLHCPCHTALSYIFSTNSPAHLAGTFFSLSFHSQSTMGFRTLRLPGNDVANKLARWGKLFLHSLVVSLLLSLVSTLLYFRTGGV